MPYAPIVDFPKASRPNRLGPDGLARRRRALEAVEKVVTALAVGHCLASLDVRRIGFA
jgi:hypothetical protein